jgi:hypothetical protein
MSDLNAGDPQEDELLKDLAVDCEIEVTCPYCGETVVIILDPAGGGAQDYVEDCEICCRPWRIRVRYDDMGAARVHLEEVA